MKIAVIGATGTAGRKIVDNIKEKGHEAIEISRSTGVDVTTGEGLESALAGAEVCIDASSPWPQEGEDIVDYLTDVTKNILVAAKNSGVQHIVYLSITNIEKPDVAKFDYYSAKAAQEEELSRGTVPFSIVRSAQWMEFAENPNCTEWREDEVVASDWYVQPVALDDIARVLVDVATGTPAHRTIAGPEPIRIPELVRMLLAARGDQRTVTVTDTPLPALGDGSLLAPADAELVGPTPQQWADSQA